MEELFCPHPHTVHAELQRPFPQKNLGEVMACGDDKANRFGAYVMNNGVPVDLTGFTVYGYVIMPNQETLKLKGTTSGNFAYVDVEQDGYACDGAVTVTIKIKGDTFKETVAMFFATVAKTKTETIVSENRVIYDAETILDIIDRMEQAEKDAEAAAETANAAAASVDAKVAEANAELGRKVDQLSDDIGDLKSALYNTDHNTLPLISSKAFTFAGYIRASDGKFIEGTNNYTTDYIRVLAGDKFYIKTRVPTNRTQIAFYTGTDGSGYELISVGDNNYNEVEYTVEKNGFVRFSASYTESFPILICYESEIPLQYKNKIDKTINPITDKISNLEEKTNGILNIGNYEFEIGAIGATTQGWEYTDSTKRVRTKENVTIQLEIGDKIKLKSYDGYRIGIAWLSYGGNYGSAPWKQEDYTCVTPGYYIVQITKVPETVITNMQELVDLLVIERISNLSKHALLTLPFSNIKVTNHKGFSSIAPEDTLPAYLLSKELGYETVECDISFTSDRVPVLLHDETIDRTSNGTGYIYDLTFEQVRQYDFGSWKNAKYAGTKIPSFEEFIKFCKFAGLKAQCEIKATDVLSSSDIQNCTEIVKRYAMADAITWTSNSTAYLSIVSGFLPKARLGVIAHSISSALISNARALKTNDNDVFITVSLSIITDEIVNSIMSSGLAMEAFLVNTKAQLETLNSYVSGITTDVLNVPALAYDYAKTLVL